MGDSIISEWPCAFQPPFGSQTSGGILRSPTLVKPPAESLADIPILDDKEIAGPLRLGGLQVSQRIGGDVEQNLSPSSSVSSFPETVPNLLNSRPPGTPISPPIYTDGTLGNSLGVQGSASIYDEDSATNTGEGRLLPPTTLTESGGETRVRGDVNSVNGSRSDSRDLSNRCSSPGLLNGILLRPPRFIVPVINSVNSSSVGASTSSSLSCTTAGLSCQTGSYSSELSRVPFSDFSSASPPIFCDNSNNTVSDNGSDVRAPFLPTSLPEITSMSGFNGFLSEPTILADKFIILGTVDSSTVNAIHAHTHEPRHIKTVTGRSAREVCAQQSLLGCDNCGVREATEAVICPGGGQRAWLVFPPHYGDLHLYVRMRRRLREAEAQRLFAQMARTVEKCHTSGLVLRDLKLRKFVFADANRETVWLESVEDSVACGAVDLLQDKHGCPAYVAPEILSASAYSGRHADMWGMGVILYTMLVGRYPFHNPDTSTLFAKIRCGKFAIPEWVSSRARHLILSLLRRQPNRRLTATQVLQHPWITHTPRDHAPRDPLDQVVPGLLLKAPRGFSERKQ